LRKKAPRGIFPTEKQEVWRNVTTRSLIICTFHSILLGRIIMKGEMDGACRTQGSDEKYMHRNTVVGRVHFGVIVKEQ
jgi:hypothetical protein